MNLLHRWICHSEHWKKQLRDEMVPWVLEGLDLGADVLELGPGPGFTTDLLHQRCHHLTAVEIDPNYAGSLEDRLRGANVNVLHADATAMPLPDQAFSGAVAFTMLHHVPSQQLQDQLFREVHRVLRPGAVFAGTDSIPRVFLRLAHIGDTYVPIDYHTLGARLEMAGFLEVEIERGEKRFRFRARRA
jgi:SAM-dependent methyltransferase